MQTITFTEPEPGFNSGTLAVAGGDLHFGENYTQTTRVLTSDQQRYQDSLAYVRAITTRSAFSFVNLETPLSLPRDNNDALKGKDYIHWADPAKTVFALTTLGIDAVTLANNHSLDQGQPALDDTARHLSQSGIAAFGAGADLHQAQAPLLRTIFRPDGKPLTLAVFGMFEERASYREQFKFYAEQNRPGVANLDVDAFQDAVKQLREQYSELYVIAYPHWGQNYTWASAEQVRLARRLVDAGADLVLGHGAHTLQEIEHYRSKWILYGIGNFLFQAPGRYDDISQRRAYSLLVEMSFGRQSGEAPTIRLRPFLSDNQESGYQPQPVSASRAENILRLLRGRSRSIGLEGKIVEEDGLRGAAIELSQDGR